MEQIECSETSAYKIQMPGNYPEEGIKQGFMCYNKTTHIKILMKFTNKG